MLAVLLKAFKSLCHYAKDVTIEEGVPTLNSKSDKNTDYISDKIFEYVSFLKNFDISGLHVLFVGVYFLFYGMFFVNLQQHHRKSVL